MFDLLKQIRSLLSPLERRSAIWLLIMIIVMAALDVFGVASILPFMSVMTNPGVVVESQYLSYLYDLGDFSGTDEFLRFLGVIVFFLIVLSVAFKAVTTYALLRFSYMRNYTLSVRLVEVYLRQPYEWFLSRHSSELGKNVLNEVQQTVNGILIPLILVIAHGSVVVAMLVLLIVVDPMISLFVIFILGGLYFSVYIILHSYIAHIGAERMEANRIRFKTIQEGFSGIKEVKTGNLESSVSNVFSVSAERFSKLVAIAQLVGQIPRFFLEVLAFGGILVIVIYLLGKPGGMVDGLPVLSTFAFAGYKIMPSLQQVFVNATQMRFSRPQLDALYSDLIKYNALDEMGVKIQKIETTPLGLEKKLCLKNVFYKYPDQDNEVLHNINIDITAKTSVGIVGSTGAGKTTLIDIILGLLKPKSGSLVVDGKVVNNKNIQSWQRSIGYVPQHIYLKDDSLEANIAFGIQKDAIDHYAVRRAAKIAKLDMFILQNLPEGYRTLVGEQGIRLSGGQRQRIGIARALYHDPDVLILDEATSALDNLTERAIIDSIKQLKETKTVLIIAHRLSTIKDCDEIIMLRDGNIYARGTYDYLLRENKNFKRLVERS